MAKGQKDKRAEKATKAAEAAEKRAASAARNPGVDPAGRNRSTGSTMHWEPKVRAAEEAPPGACQSAAPGSSCHSAEGGVLDGDAVMKEVSADPTTGQSASGESGWKSSGQSWADESERPERPPVNAAVAAMAELKRRARDLVLTQGFDDGLAADDPVRELVTEANGVWWYHTTEPAEPQWGEDTGTGGPWADLDWDYIFLQLDKDPNRGQVILRNGVFPLVRWAEWGKVLRTPWSREQEEILPPWCVRWEGWVFSSEPPVGSDSDKPRSRCHHCGAWGHQVENCTPREWRLGKHCQYNLCPAGLGPNPRFLRPRCLPQAHVGPELVRRWEAMLDAVYKAPMGLRLKDKDTVEKEKEDKRWQQRFSVEPFGLAASDVAGAKAQPNKIEGWSEASSWSKSESWSKAGGWAEAAPPWRSSDRWDSAAWSSSSWQGSSPAKTWSSSATGLPGSDKQGSATTPALPAPTAAASAAAYGAPEGAGAAERVG